MSEMDDSSVDMCKKVGESEEHWQKRKILIIKFQRMCNDTKTRLSNLSHILQNMKVLGSTYSLDVVQYLERLAESWMENVENLPLNAKNCTQNGENVENSPQNGENVENSPQNAKNVIKQGGSIENSSQNAQNVIIKDENVENSSQNAKTGIIKSENVENSPQNAKKWMENAESGFKQGESIANTPKKAKKPTKKGKKLPKKVKKMPKKVKKNSLNGKKCDKFGPVPEPTKNDVISSLSGQETTRNEILPKSNPQCSVPVEVGKMQIYLKERQLKSSFRVHKSIEKKSGCSLKRKFSEDEEPVVSKLTTNIKRVHWGRGTKSEQDASTDGGLPYYRLNELLEEFVVIELQESGEIVCPYKILRDTAILNGLHLKFNEYNGIMYANFNQQNITSVEVIPNFNAETMKIVASQAALEELKKNHKLIKFVVPNNVRVVTRQEVYKRRGWNVNGRRGFGTSAKNAMDRFLGGYAESKEICSLVFRLDTFSQEECFFMDSVAGRFGLISKIEEHKGRFEYVLKRTRMTRAHMVKMMTQCWNKRVVQISLPMFTLCLENTKNLELTKLKPGNQNQKQMKTTFKIPVRIRKRVITSPVAWRTRSATREARKQYEKNKPKIETVLLE